MKAATGDASTAVTGVVQNAYKTEKKILLDVKLDSPKMIIVKSTLSPEAIQVDLGNLVVKNKLEEVYTGTAKNAIVDKMELTLEGISISR